MKALRRFIDTTIDKLEVCEVAAILMRTGGRGWKALVAALLVPMSADLEWSDK